MDIKFFQILKFFVDILLFDTIYPIIILSFILICQNIHILMIQKSHYHNHKESKQQYISKISSYYFKAMLIFIYYMLPFVTTTIFQTFR